MLEGVLQQSMYRTRQEAIAAGSSVYFTGKPCIKGHTAKRYVSGSCSACLTSRRKARDKQHGAARRAKHADKLKMYADEYRAKFKPWRRYYAAQRMLTGARRALQKKATPKWTDKRLMRGIYERAVEAGLTVDHVVPLKSPLVCGLHCEDNLSPIPATDNTRKGNRWWPDMPD
jgi:hypothetical protein